MSNKYLQFFKEYIIVALACMVMAFNTSYFFIGNKLAQGGVVVYLLLFTICQI